MMSAKTFSLDIRKDGIGILTMDVPGESMNTLKASFADEIRTLLAEVKGNGDLIGLVIVSGKKDSFVAGADIAMLAACTSAMSILSSSSATSAPAASFSLRSLYFSSSASASFWADLGIERSQKINCVPLRSFHLR